MNIKRFNEDIDDNGGRKEMTIRVKHLIEYLSQFDPETPVYLDKDGWGSDLHWSGRNEDKRPKNELEVIEQRGLFDKHKNSLTINN